MRPCTNIKIHAHAACIGFVLSITLYRKASYMRHVAHGDQPIKKFPHPHVDICSAQECITIQIAPRFENRAAASTHRAICIICIWRTYASREAALTSHTLARADLKGYI